MKLDIRNAIRQMSPDIKGPYADGYRFTLSELVKHMEELSARWKSGDTKVVDEFLSLYCLDDTPTGGIGG